MSLFVESGLRHQPSVKPHSHLQMRMSPHINGMYCWNVYVIHIKHTKVTRLWLILMTGQKGTSFIKKKPDLMQTIMGRPLRGAFWWKKRLIYSFLFFVWKEESVTVILSLKQSVFPAELYSCQGGSKRFDYNGKVSHTSRVGKTQMTHPTYSLVGNSGIEFAFQQRNIEDICKK